MPKKLSKEDWEHRIFKLVGDRFELVRWRCDNDFGSNKRVIMRCLSDGKEWVTRPCDIMNGKGCPMCSCKRLITEGERIEQINSNGKIEFLRWDGEFKNAFSRAVVRCLADGYVWSSNINSLINSNRGCANCSGQRRWTAKERIEHINKKPSVSFVNWDGEYTNVNSRAYVRCEKCLYEWCATVDQLVNEGTGCPCCAKYGYDKSKAGFLYSLRSECGRYVKVGISNNPERRQAELIRSTPFTFSCIEQLEGDGVKISELEKHFHDKYERAGFTGFDGCTEWLVCSNELLSELRGLSIEHE